MGAISAIWEMPDLNNPKRIAFKKLLQKVADAMHDIEWVESGDMSKGDEDKAIDAVFKILKVNSEEIYKLHAFDRIASLVKVSELVK